MTGINRGTNASTDGASGTKQKSTGKYRVNKLPK